MGLVYSRALPQPKTGKRTPLKTVPVLLVPRIPQVSCTSVASLSTTGWRLVQAFLISGYWTIQ